MPATKFIGALAVFKTPVSGLAYGIVLLGIWGLSSSIVRLRTNQPVQYNDRGSKGFETAQLMSGCLKNV
jgi:uncharacterized membrane protein YecN with MAPEG domain